jgi:hypothetical protein
VKFRGNRADAKRQNEKIERIQRPAQEAGDKRVALCRGKPPKMR